MPSELWLPDDRPAMVSTVLGSCVAVTLFSPPLGNGAICHAMLPAARGKSGFSFVDNALSQMLAHFDELGVQRRHLEAKLFGGADMFEVLNPGGATTVGKQNIEAALFLLDQAGVRLTAQDTGGLQGRKLMFFTQTGEVLLKRLGNQRQSSQG